MKAVYKKGDIVKTEEGVMIITESAYLSDQQKPVYKVQQIKVLGEMLMDENEVFYKVTLEELPNIRSYE